jgi:hypothetical protein
VVILGGCARCGTFAMIVGKVAHSMGTPCPYVLRTVDSLRGRASMHVCGSLI